MDGWPINVEEFAVRRRVSSGSGDADTLASSQGGMAEGVSCTTARTNQESNLPNDLQ